MSASFHVIHKLLFVGLLPLLDSLANCSWKSEEKERKTKEVTDGNFKQYFSFETNSTTPPNVSSTLATTVLEEYKENDILFIPNSYRHYSCINFQNGQRIYS
jgi:hypothetical protein